MKRIFWIALLTAIALGNATNSFAGNERRPFYSGVRCLAMGGACIAVANDETGLIVNPAAIGKIRDVYGTVFDPELEFGYQFQGFYYANSFSNFTSLEDLLASLSAKKSTYFHSKMQMFPSFVGSNFGVGLYANYLLDAEMSADGSSIDTYYRNDNAFVLGYAFRLLDGRVKVGFNAKAVNRIEVDNSTLSSSSSLNYTVIASEGTALATDVGVILTAPWSMLPTLSAVARDVGNTTFDKADGVRMHTTNRPKMIKQDVDVALAVFPIHSNHVRSSWSVEYRGLLTGQSETDKAKLLHTGFEVNFGDIFFWRGGYNQRYWTTGFELSTEHFQWQFATYGEEIGTAATPREDRRYTMKFAYRY